MLPFKDPLPYHLASIALQVLVFWLPPFRGRAAIFIPLIIFTATCTFWPWERAFATEGARIRSFQLYCTIWVITIHTLEKLFFSTPELHFWRVSKDTKQEDVSTYGFGLKKLGWAVDLCFNSRLIGWNQQVKGVVPLNKAEYGSKKRFLLWQLLRLVKLQLAMDLTYHFLGTQPTFKRLMSPEHGGVSLADGSVVEKFFTLWAYGTYLACILKRGYVQGTILAVGLGINDPEEWPRLFGLLSETVTVRKFWGSYWHQFIRRAFTSYGLFLVRTFRMRQGSKLSSYTQLYVAFIMSGIGHAISIANIPFHDGVPADSSRWSGTMWFFVGQALAITFEDMVIGIYNRQKLIGLSERTRKVIGYVWVMFWFYCSLPWALDEQLNRAMGYFPPKISVVRFVKHHYGLA